VKAQDLLVTVLITLGATASTSRGSVLPQILTLPAPSEVEQASGTFPTEAQSAIEKIPDEEVVPQDPGERSARLAMNKRFNGGPRDLTRSQDHLVEHYAPRILPVIPTKESGIIFVGSLLKVQPYLSADRTRIYTELTFRVEDTLKYRPGVPRSTDGMIVIDSIGGVLRLRSGQVIRDDTDLDYGGKPYVGGRYVVFANERPEGETLDIAKAYELRNGRVLKLANDGKPGTTFLSTTENKADDPLSYESTFFQAIELGERK
jgi:hypothetical protein